MTRTSHASSSERLTRTSIWQRRWLGSLRRGRLRRRLAPISFLRPTSTPRRRRCVSPWIARSGKSRRISRDTVGIKGCMTSVRKPVGKSISSADCAEAQAAEAERLGTRISVSADSADAYLQVRGDQARLIVAEKQIDIDSRLLDLVRQRRARGVASDREVAQADALLQQARTTIPLLRIDLEAELNRLDVLMGAQPGTYAKELATAADVPAILVISSDDRPLDVLRRRSAVIAAERQVAAANARIGVAISDYNPKISLSGVLGFESLTGSDLFSSRAFQPVGAGALRWRLFDFGKVSAEVVAARGADAEALARYRQSVLRAAEDVEDAFVTLVQTELRMRELEDEVASLTRARDLSQQSYVAGVIPLTDVLDSDRQLLAARDDLAHTQADAARAAVRTFRALGGGWSSESLPYLSDDKR